MFNKKLAERVTALETRVGTLERQVTQVKKDVYFSIDDNPPTVEHAYAIKEILANAKILAEAHAKDPMGSPLGEAAGTVLEWLRAIGK